MRAKLHSREKGTQQSQETHYFILMALKLLVRFAARTFFQGDGASQDDKDMSRERLAITQFCEMSGGTSQCVLYLYLKYLSYF